MNNLLQSLSSQRLRPHIAEGDLRQLLQAVTAGRGNDSKLADAFYESLEGVLHDLRTVTPDNRDAEAFLKPVPKSDYPDYYDTISNPMDLQTMLRKVKQKNYKSKREFADDLDLIWTNCFTFNTGENHPLRLCAQRLRAKANKLLRNITDRKERIEPPVASTFGHKGVSPKPNGIFLNGHSRHSSVASTPRVLPASKQGTPAPPPVKVPAKDVPFADMPAFERTPSGMAAFLDLDAQLDSNGAGPSTLKLPSYHRPPSLQDTLRSYIEDDAHSDDDIWEVEPLNGDLGDKRKLTMNGNHRPRKRARFRSRERTQPQEPTELWWQASNSSALMRNAVPTLKYAASEPYQPNLPPLPPAPMRKKKGKRKKRKDGPDPEKSSPKSLLYYMNNNIKAMRRVRRTHDKFLSLNLAAGDESGGSGQAAPVPIEPPEPVGDDDPVEDQLDEKPWRCRGTGLEIDEREADDCLHWMGTKVLEHVGFQSASKVALDVFAGIAADYLSNVGRTFRFLCDKYSTIMTAEEIILHSLFESGITRIQDLDRYITDDVVRYGSRLADLEKKLVTAYQDVTAAEAIDDDAFFGAEDEEEDGELVMGNFADSFGDDFLGLRELGIASEFGLQSLTIPKKLLRGKNKGPLNRPDAKPKEPPPPYPPPPSFVPLDSTKVDDQIGLLKQFYKGKVPVPYYQQHPVANGPPGQALSHPLGLPTAPIPMPQSYNPPWSAPPPPALPASAAANAPPVMIPDDIPPPWRTKIGPLGQVLKSGPSGSTAKKKAAKDKPVVNGTAALANPDLIRMDVDPPPAPATPGGGEVDGVDSKKKAKASPTKKKQDKDKSSKPESPLPPVIIASA